MKNFKKILALVVAMVMIIGTMSMSAFADQGAATPDGSISISGLDDSDTVALYQVIGWKDGTGWEFVNGFSDPQISPHLGTANTPFAINQDMVNTLSSQITNSTTATDGTLSDGTFEATVAPGMYIAIVTAGTAGTIYNPIIVSSDFVTGGNTIDASAADSVIPSSTGGAAVAKKSTITLEKEGTDRTTVDENNTETVAVGDTVDFDIDTQIPPFATYVKPIFTITDELSDGIRLGAVDTIQVTVTGITAVRDTDYTVTRNNDHKFTVEFKEAFLKKVAANAAVHIDYPATITSDAVKSINPENNTVTLEYQRDPKSNSDETTTKIRDITNHYSFSIDGKLLGNDNYSATEVVKVGVSADGTEITETIQLANGQSVGALEGAKFKLVYDNNGKAGEESVKKYKIVNGEAVQDGVWEDIESDGQGRISITGLDAGVYWLVETAAPAGYIKMQEAVKVEIQTHETPVTYTDEDGCVINTTELDWYKIFIGGTETAYYEITNSKDVSEASSTIGDSVVGTDANKGKLKNTKGVELPSTGGVGTTLFYVIGAILVLGAGILLVSKRRMSAN